MRRIGHRCFARPALFQSISIERLEKATRLEDFEIASVSVAGWLPNHVHRSPDAFHWHCCKVAIMIDITCMMDLYIQDMCADKVHADTHRGTDHATISITSA